MEKSPKDAYYRLVLTSNPSSKLNLSDWASSSEGENLTDKEATDGGNVGQTSPPALDPVFGYKIHQDLSKISGKDVFDVTELGSISKFVSSHIEWGLEPGSFLVTNLSVVAEQYAQWKRELPMVEPFYAVKCNPDPVILRVLAALGCGFDCATMGEIDLVLNGLGEELNFGVRGLASTKIVYANPAKMHHMLQFALDNEVNMTVFDGEDELYKIASLATAEHKPQLLLRLSTNDAHSVCVFSHKFGCPVSDSTRLLKIAQSLGLEVVGVSFHVGSGCRDASAYSDALRDTLSVFETARSLGMKDMRVVDIGGGFPGDTGGYGGEGMPTFQELASVIRSSLEVFHSKLPASHAAVRVIAEPGRYFASAATAVATKIYSRKGGNGNSQALYVDDGVYGSFNNVLYDHATPKPSRVNKSTSNSLSSSPSTSPSVSPDVSGKTDVSEGLEEEEDIATAVFGPTCDGLDQMCSLKDTKLQRCAVGDWLLWENMGAYTHTASFVFNGYTHIPNRIHCVL